MEKIIWVISNGRALGTREDGWKVKHISACAVSERTNAGQAYIVIEKQDN